MFKRILGDERGQTFLEILLALAVIAIPVAVFATGLGDAISDGIKNLTDEVRKVGN